MDVGWSSVMFWLNASTVGPKDVLGPVVFCDLFGTIPV